MKKFSQRHGFKPVKDVIQIEGMDSDLRNTLWNLVEIHYWPYEVRASLLINMPDVHTLFVRLWLDYFKKPVDTIKNLWEEARRELRTYFFACQWYEAYDFIEFVAKSYPVDSSNKRFVERCNERLEREVSGYRFIGGVVAPITSKEEIAEIEEALESTKPLTPIAIHLNTAMGLLSDRKAPDYRNSMKESISAVEAICRLIAGTGGATLGQALTTLKPKIDIHPALQKAFDSLYGYTSDEDGIRHALMDAPDLDFEDAKLMLVTCAAFINYLKLKSAKAGINF